MWIETKFLQSFIMPKNKLLKNRFLHQFETNIDIIMMEERALSVITLYFWFRYEIQSLPEASVVFFRFN